MQLSSLLPLAGAVAAGMAVAAQPGVNGQLAKRMDSPFQAAVISFTFGLLILVAICVVRGIQPFKIAALAGAPWFHVVGGGFIGAFFVSTALTVAPRIGAAPWIGLMLGGQVVCSLLLDHFGLVGFAKHPINVSRVLGALMLLGGVVLISRN